MADVRVGILVGSESDRERMQGAMDVLDALDRRAAVAARGIAVACEHDGDRCVW